MDMKYQFIAVGFGIVLRETCGSSCSMSDALSCNLEYSNMTNPTFQIYEH
jgi:hypothetical protein